MKLPRFAFPIAAALLGTSALVGTSPMATEAQAQSTENSGVTYGGITLTPYDDGYGITDGGRTILFSSDGRRVYDNGRILPAGSLSAQQALNTAQQTLQLFSEAMNNDFQLRYNEINETIAKINQRSQLGNTGAALLGSILGGSQTTNTANNIASTYNNIEQQRLQFKQQRLQFEQQRLQNFTNSIQQRLSLVMNVQSLDRSHLIQRGQIITNASRDDDYVDGNGDVPMIVNRTTGSITPVTLSSR